MIATPVCTSLKKECTAVLVYMTRAVSNGSCIVERSWDIYHARMHVRYLTKRKQCDTD